MDMIVRLAGEIDCATGPAVQADLLRTMSEHVADVADLGEVTFLDCAGLGSLVAGRVWAAEHGLRFWVTRPALRPDGDESDGTPLVRFVLAPRGRSGAASDATLLAAVGPPPGCLLWTRT